MSKFKCSLHTLSYTTYYTITIIKNITILNRRQTAVTFDAVISILNITIRERTAGTAVEFYPILIGTAWSSEIKGDRRRRGAYS